MNPYLIEPEDVLFFRDAVPMAAGEGKGAGCRLPFPSTVHEAFRASLLRANGETVVAKKEPGRPRGAQRKGNWHDDRHGDVPLIGTRAFRSLRTWGPFPWHESSGLLLPIPSDVTCRHGRLSRLELGFNDFDWGGPAATPADFSPCCLPLAVTPPDKKSRLQGWWTVAQMADYLAGRDRRDPPGFAPFPHDSSGAPRTPTLWAPEYRVGVKLDPAAGVASEGQLYAGAYLRPDSGTRLLVWVGVADPAAASGREAAARQREIRQLAALDWLQLGGETRLARLRQTLPEGRPLPNELAPLRAAPEPPSAGPCLLKWVLVTPAIFAHGSLPGWCADSRPDSPAAPRLPAGRVCLKLPGRAHLVSWCLSRPQTVSGWDALDDRAKPTLLAVPAGGVYYFLCENEETAATLARELHWRPRSDFYGEKGFRLGFVSFAVRLHPTSPDVSKLANQIFP